MDRDQQNRYWLMFNYLCLYLACIFGLAGMIFHFQFMFTLVLISGAMCIAALIVHPL